MGNSSLEVFDDGRPKSVSVMNLSSFVAAQELQVGTLVHLYSRGHRGLWGDPVWRQENTGSSRHARPPGVLKLRVAWLLLNKLGDFGKVDSSPGVAGGLAE